MITAHRGSTWYFPEHTLDAYYYAFFEGADFIDVDIHPTADGEFIVYHDPVLMGDDLSGFDEYDKIFSKNRSNAKFKNNIDGRTYA